MNLLLPQILPARPAPRPTKNSVEKRSGTPDTDNRWRVMSVVGPQGQPREVSNQQLSDAINNSLVGTSANCNNVAVFSFTVSDTPTQSELQQVVDKANELICALRR